MIIKENINGVYHEREATAAEIAEYEAAKAEQEKQNVFDEIENLKSQLSATDYKTLKYVEGWISEEEYAPIKAERQALRDRINELEQEVE